MIPAALCAIAIIGMTTAEAAASKNTSAQKATSLGTHGVSATDAEAQLDAVPIVGIATSEADQSAKAAATTENRSASAPAGTTRRAAFSAQIVGSHAALITAIPKAAPAQHVMA